MLFPKKRKVGGKAALAAGLVAVALAHFLGCSGNAVKSGDPNDSEFLTTKAFVDGFLVLGVMENMAAGVENQSGFVPPNDSDFVPSYPRLVPGGFQRHPLSAYVSILKRPAASRSIDSGYANGWHYFIFDTSGTLDSSGAVGTVHIADSVQFRNPGGPQQFPDSTTNRFEIRFLGQAALQDSGFSFGGELYFNHIFQRLGGSLSVNGSERDSLLLDTDSLDVGAKLNQTVTNVVFQKSSQDSTLFDDCPVTGTVRLTGSVTVSGPLLPQGPVSVTFDVTLTFNGQGQLRVVVVDNDRHLRWEYSLTGFCNGSV
jgi:hypothetical protein